MGMIRKSMSVGSLGLIRFRSPNERTARNTRRIARAVDHQQLEQLMPPPPGYTPSPPPTVPPPPSAIVTAPNLVDELARLTELHKQGALTDTEFEAAKAQLLAQR